jgi:succinoglycan biosynthesis protein ExoL
VAALAAAGDPRRRQRVWIARNLDMLLLAVFARGLCPGPPPRLVYECLDIHGLFTRADAIGAVHALGGTADAGAVRSSDPVLAGVPRALFRTGAAGDDARRASGEQALGLRTIPRATADPAQRTETAPFILGWVGSLRCAKSLEILAGTARGWGRRSRSGATARCIAMPCRVSTRPAAHPNIRHAGAYRYPDALGAIYTACDAVWAQDLWQSGANSDWLLPNRIYEASYFGCPSIALAGTETGRRVAADGLGFTVEEPTAEALTALLRGLTPERTRAASARLLARPEGDFRLTEAELAAALAPVLGRAARLDVRAGAETIRCAG